MIYTGPTDATAEGQIEMINSLIAQKVNAIAISANDPDALVPALKKAMDRGITVISWDSGVAPEGRQMHLNPSRHQADRRDDHQARRRLSAGGRRRRHPVGLVDRDQPERLDRGDEEGAAGEVPEDQARRHRLWRRPLRQEHREAKGLIQSYPNLKAIIAPTTVGVVAAAQVVTDAGKIGKINVTGLGLPSEMAAHVDNGASQGLRALEPDRPRLLGDDDRLQSRHQEGEAKPGAEISMGRVGEVTLDDTNSGRDGRSVRLRQASNIEEFVKIY